MTSNGNFGNARPSLQELVRLTVIAMAVTPSSTSSYLLVAAVPRNIPYDNLHLIPQLYVVNPMRRGSALCQQTQGPVTQQGYDVVDSEKVARS